MSGAATIHEAFEAQVRRTPDLTAVVDGTSQLTYAQLNARANRLARHFRARGAGRGSRVGVCLRRDEWLIPALLAVLKTGAAYVPLDPAYPSERLALIAEDAGLQQVLVSDHETAERLPRCDAIVVPDLDLSGECSGDLGLDVPADAAAYVIFTSGSTGRPKGVVVEHRNTLTLLTWALGHYDRDEWAGMLASTSICFDVSVMEIYPPLMCGGAVLLADNLLALHELPGRDAVTMICGVPSALAVLLERPLPTSVRTVNPAGEALTRALADRLHSQPGVRRVVNCYGPTECTTYCLVAEVSPEESGEPPIGTPIAGGDALVRDHGGEPVGAGGTGELWITGPLVTAGYLHRPELTAERFVVDRATGRRAYRTGDLVRVAGGRFFYLGRRDDQVKIRGYRVELGEVDAVLQRHPSVAHAVVLAPADADGVRNLIAYVSAPGADLTEAALREFLTARLPHYLVPTRFLVLDRIPTGPTGKADRTALAGLPLPASPGADGTPDDIAPGEVAGIIAEVLRVPSVRPGDRFTDLGGHSLAAARLCAALRERLDVAVSLSDVLAASTVADLDRLVAAAPVVQRTERGPALAERDSYPLTDVQKEIWALRHLSAAPDASTVAFRLRLRAQADGGAVQRALNAILVRQAALRTTYHQQGGAVRMRISAPRDVPVEEYDLRGLDATRRRLRIDALADAAGHHVFDLTDGSPLLRVTACRTGEDETELVVIADHIAFDGWSIGVLMEELAAGIAGTDPGPAPAFQVTDVAVAEDGWHDAGTSGWWAATLNGIAPPYEIPGRPAEPPMAGIGRTARVPDAALAGRIDEFTRRYGGTPFAVYATALAITVADLTGRAQTLLGVAHARRTDHRLDRLIGPLIGLLPLAVDIDGHATFVEMVQRTATATLTAITHADVPSADMVTGIDRPVGRPALPVIISMQPPQVPTAVDVGDVDVELLGELRGGAAGSALAIYLNQTVQGPQAAVEYDTALYSPPDADAFLDRYLRVLDGCLAGPGRRLADVALVDEDEMRRLIDLGCPATPVHPVDPVNAVLRQAGAHPEVVAVQSGQTTVTYRELADLSAGVADRLTAAGAGPEQVVAVCLAREDARLPAVLLGVARSGAAYLPLDLDHPLERLRYQAEDCDVRIVLGGGAGLTVAAQVASGRTVTVIDVSEVAARRLPAVDRAGDGAADPDALFYVLYTSGSTGRPKGVEVTRGNFAFHLASMRQEYGIGSTDAWLAPVSVSFDVAHLGMWLPLAVGGRCVLTDRTTALDGFQLAEEMTAAGVTVLNATPTLLRGLMAADWPGDPGITVLSGGEALDQVLASWIVERAGALGNVYGPTEATVWATAHRYEAPTGTGSVSIGRPLPGYRIYLLDAAGRFVPPGSIGELWIGGAAVARGYRNQRQRTEAVFTADPLAPGARRYATGDLARWLPDGNLAFLGRRDQQVKIRGYRVEPGEIETVLREHPAIADAAVLVSAGPGDPHLIGYLAGAEVPAPAVVEQFLRDRLPDYAVPRQWIGLPELPTLPSGKADRQSLRRIEAPAPQPHEPAPAGDADGTEELVRRIWAEVLERTAVRRDDDFFRLGGHSFAATLVIGRLRTVLDRKIPVRMIFDRPVVSDFAAALDELLAADNQDIRR